ncbi:SEC6, partial [Prunus dulcis]
YKNCLARSSNIASLKHGSHNSELTKQNMRVQRNTDTSPGNGRQVLHFPAQVHRKGLKPNNRVEILLLLMVAEGQALVVQRTVSALSWEGNDHGLQLWGPSYGEGKHEGRIKIREEEENKKKGRKKKKDGLGRRESKSLIKSKYQILK